LNLPIQLGVYLFDIRPVFLKKFTLNEGNFEEFELVDLLEGSSTIEMDDHWYWFDINLKLNREKLK
jgi:hypothetical protein